MNIVAQIAVVLLLLPLSWAALHDILKGNEPDYSLEYGMLAASGIAFTALIVTALRKKGKPTRA